MLGQHSFWGMLSYAINMSCLYLVIIALHMEGNASLTKMTKFNPKLFLG